MRALMLLAIVQGAVAIVTFSTLSGSTTSSCVRSPASDRVDDIILTRLSATAIAIDIIFTASSGGFSSSSGICIGVLHYDTSTWTMIHTDCFLPSSFTTQTYTRATIQRSIPYFPLGQHIIRTILFDRDSPVDVIPTGTTCACDTGACGASGAGCCRHFDNLDQPFQNVNDGSSPYVTSTSIPDGAIGIEPGSRSISMIFSEDLRDVYSTSAGITILCGSRNVGYSYSAPSDVSSITVTPYVNLGEFCAVSIDNTPTDVTGTPFTPFSTVFQVRDGVKPYLSTSSPLDGAIGVERSGTRISMTFSEAMSTSATQSTSTYYQLRCPSTYYTLSYSSGTSTSSRKEFTHNTLPAGARCTMTVTSNVLDASGESMVPESFSFTIRDLVPPTLSSSNPSHMATLVSPGAFSLTFSEDMHTSSTAAAISLTCAGDLVVLSIPIWTALRTVSFTYDPEGPPPVASCDIRVSTSARDTSGENVASTITVSFSLTGCSSLGFSDCDSGCTWCTTFGTDSCVSSGECPACGTTVSPSECGLSSGCDWCTTEGADACKPVGTCNACGDTLSASPCNLASDCSWCTSTSSDLCLDAGTCPACSTLAVGPCGAASGCDWCDAQDVPECSDVSTCSVLTSVEFASVPRVQAGVPFLVRFQALDATGGVRQELHDQINLTLLSGSTVLDWSEGVLSGNHTATLEATLAATLTIRAENLRDESLLGSTTVDVYPGPPYGLTSSAEGVPFGNSTFIVGTYFGADVRASDEFGNSLVGYDDHETVVLEAQLGDNMFPCVAEDITSGVWSANMTNTVAGDFNLTLVAGGTIVAGTPFTMRFVPELATDVTMTTLDMPGGTDVVAGAQNVLLITARDRFGNQLRFGQEGPWNVELILLEDPEYVESGFVVNDLDDGSYWTQVRATRVGVYQVSVVLRGEMVPPIEIIVSSGPVDVSRTEILGADAIVASPTARFAVQLLDVFGNPLGGAGYTVDASWTNIGANSSSVFPTVTQFAGGGVFDVIFNRTLAAPVLMSVSVEGVTIPSAPFVAHVIPGPTSPQHSIAEGPGVNISIAFERRDIWIRARDQYDNPRLEGGEEAEVRVTRVKERTDAPTVDHGNGTYTSFYIGSKTGGKFIIDVLINKESVKDSPFAVDEIGQCDRGFKALTIFGPCEECDIGFFAPELHSRACLRCPPNTITYKRAVSVMNCTCVVGTYHPRSQDGDECLDCPDGGECVGGRRPPFSKPGFYPGDGGTVFLPCPVPEACLGGVENSCAPGYVGYICGQCDVGYYRFNNKCFKCAGSTLWIFILLLLGLWAFCGMLAWFNTKNRSTSRFATLAIALNSMQVIALYGNMDLQWPVASDFVFRFMSLANFNFEISSPECSVQASNYFILKYYAQLFLPVIVAVLLFLCFLVMLLHRAVVSKIGPSFQAKHPALCEEPQRGQGVWPHVRFELVALIWRHELSASKMRNVCIRSMYQMLVFIYLPLADTVLSYFDCDSSEDGIYVLEEYPNVVCYTGLYWTHFATAVIFTLVYVAGIPALVFGVLLYKRRRMDPIKFALRYGFWVSRYIEKCYMWEVLILLRKLGVVMCMLFLSNSLNYQLGCAVIVLMMFFVVQVSFRPFGTPVHNQAEQVSLCAAIGVLFFGMMFKGNSHLFIFDICVLSMLLANLVFICYAIYLDARGLVNEMKMAAEEFETMKDVTDALGMQEMSEHNHNPGYMSQSSEMNSMSSHMMSAQPMMAPQSSAMSSHPGEVDTLRRLSFDGNDELNSHPSGSIDYPSGASSDGTTPSIPKPPPISEKDAFASFDGGSVSRNGSRAPPVPKKPKNRN